MRKATTSCTKPSSENRRSSRGLKCVNESRACSRSRILPGAMTPDEVVRHYIDNYRATATHELEFYAAQPNLESAVRAAALCRRPDGKRHSHQYRIPKAVLSEARRSLGEAPLGNCHTFGALHDAVDTAIGKIKGIGELTVYDIAVRIGAFLRLEPEVVHLHAGTRAGALALGLGKGATVLRIDELPAPFRRLRPCEINFHCCFNLSLQLLGKRLLIRFRPGMFVD